MKHPSFLAVILSLFFTFSQVYSEAYLNTPLIEHIHQNGFAGVKHREGSKLYLNENALVLSAQGMLLLGEFDEAVSIPCLHSDKNGCYILLNENEVQLIEHGWTGKVLNYCPGCGLEYFLTCKNPKCPLKKDQSEEDSEEDDSANS